MQIKNLQLLISKTIILNVKSIDSRYDHRHFTNVAGTNNGILVN